MNKISSSILIGLIAISISSLAQNNWTVGENYVRHNNQDLFLNGVNYIPSHNWMMMLENWDEAQVEKDIIGMKSLGVKCIRFFPLWHMVQPTPNVLDEKIMEHIDRVLDLGAKHGLYFQITPITGWMSGGTFLPDWALGNIFTDTDMIEGEKFLVREFAKRYKNHPALQGFDFGNEINVLIEVMEINVTPEEIDEWMQTIYKAFKEGDPNCIVTNGIGTGFDPWFNIEAISKSCDYMSVHSYPFFHGTSRLDPSIGQRTLYSGNFITEWAKMVNKPVLMQENGTTRPGVEAAKGLRVFFMSSWAEGAAGYFWWGSHMVDPEYLIHTPGLRAEYSVDKMKVGELSGDKTMGILSTENTPEVSGLEYKKCAEWIDQLGVGWVDLLPVCYILVPHTTEFHETMLKFITPFTLAKQAHFDVKLLWEDQEVPKDASAVFIAGFQLSSTGKINMDKYLNTGGKVYQSYYNSLSSNIKIFDKPVNFNDSLVLSNLDLIGNSIRVTKSEFRNIKFDDSRVFALEKTVDQNKSIFVKTNIGKGTYYYLALNIEESLQKLRNPWSNEDSYLFYKALKPETSFKINNKYIEFYQKKRGNEELLVLINHENSEQNFTLDSKNNVRLANAINHENFGEGSTFSFQLKPAEVLLIKVE